MITTGGKEARKRQRDYARIAKSAIEDQFYAKMRHEKGMFMKSAEGEIFATLYESFRLAFANDIVFFEAGWSLLENWTGRNINGAIVLLEELVCQQFPDRKEAFDEWSLNVRKQAKDALVQAERLYNREVFKRQFFERQKQKRK